MKILVTIPNGPIKDTFVSNSVVEQIKTLGDVIWNETKENFTSAELKEKLKGVDICITGWGTSRFDDDVLENADKLKIIAHTGGTVAPIISDKLYDMGVCVLSGNDVYARSVAESVVAYALCSLRDILNYNKMMKEKGWRDVSFFNEGLLDQTVGLIGFGAIARYAVELLKPFNVKIKVYSTHMTKETSDELGVELASIEEIVSTCKVISVHSAATPETHHQLNKDLLSKIKDGAVLINTARGMVIDEGALTDELMTGRFKAVLDVFEVEPLPMDSKLRDLDNVLLIPHMGGPTIDQREVVTLRLIEEINNFFANKKLKMNIDRSAAMRMTR